MFIQGNRIQGTTARAVKRPSVQLGADTTLTAATIDLQSSVNGTNGLTTNSVAATAFVECANVAAGA